MLPSELTALVAAIDRCESDAERLVADLDDEGVNWRPPSGGWSVAQCLTHLTLMNDYYLRGWDEAVKEAAAAQQGPFAGLKPTLPGRLFVWAMEPPYRMKGTANKPTAPPPRISRAGLVEAYRAGHEGYRHLVRASAAVDVNRIVRPNTFIPSVKMRLATVLLIIPAHDRRHLWQAANVRAA